MLALGRASAAAGRPASAPFMTSSAELFDLADPHATFSIAGLVGADHVHALDGGRKLLPGIDQPVATDGEGDRGLGLRPSGTIGCATIRNTVPAIHVCGEQLGVDGQLSRPATAPTSK